MKATVIFFAAACLPLASIGDTIYHCKGYGGGTFWVNTPCSKHKALIDRIATVPSGLPWDQQVQIAEGQRQTAAAQVQAQTPPQSKDSKCAQLKFERDKIWSRYSNWQYQPVEVVNPDRERTLGIQAEQRSLGCPTQ